MAKRRLTTIFCADVEGYTSHVATDEEGAVETLQACRAVMAERFARFDGREINSWGDAVIAEFDSVVEAVRCAIDVQEAVAHMPENGGNGGGTGTGGTGRTMRLRIGINLGDVVHDRGNVYGEGVNVAARLESLAPPGGILVSDTVHALAHRRLAVGFDRVEPQQVKEGEEPIGGYSLRLERSNAPPAESASKALSPLVNPALREGPRVLGRTAYASDTLDRWLSGQSRGVRVAGGFILFFFLINLLFSGIATPWFIFPSAPFFLYILWRLKSVDEPMGTPEAAANETSGEAGANETARSTNDKS